MSRIDDAVRRILTQEVRARAVRAPVHRPPQHRRDRLAAAPRGRPRGGRRVAGAAEEPAPHAAAAPAATTSTSPARNADNIGNQAGGWTLTWQGGSTNADPRARRSSTGSEDAPRGDVTYSKDASAPVGRRDVGVVVVGETPYAEGFGDVGGPQLGLRPRRRRRAAPAADDAALRRRQGRGRQGLRGGEDVRGARRLRAAADHRPGAASAIDALVAAWLPGSEGAGVADTLFGSAPFTGKLPVTWPRTLDAGADQRRRRALRPAVSVRVRAEDALAAGAEAAQQPPQSLDRADFDSAQDDRAVRALFGDELDSGHGESIGIRGAQVKSAGAPGPRRGRSGRAGRRGRRTWCGAPRAACSGPSA